MTVTHLEGCEHCGLWHRGDGSDKALAMGIAQQVKANCKRSREQRGQADVGMPPEHPEVEVYA